MYVHVLYVYHIRTAVRASPKLTANKKLTENENGFSFQLSPTTAICIIVVFNVLSLINSRYNR